MNRLALNLLGVVLALGLLAFVAMAAAGSARAAAVVGAGIMAIAIACWVLVVRSTRGSPRADRRAEPAGARGDLDAAQWPDNATWRSDANGGIGPHW